MMKFFLQFLLVAVLGLDLAAAQEWPRFRGPNGSGVDASGTVPAEWNAQSQLWSVDVPGVGHGSPAIWEDRIFLLSAVAVPAEKKGKSKGKGKAATPYEWLALCLDRETGKTVWEKRFNQQKFKGHPYTTPANHRNRDRPRRGRDSSPNAIPRRVKAIRQ